MSVFYSGDKSRGSPTTKYCLPKGLKVQLAYENEGGHICSPTEYLQNQQRIIAKDSMGLKK